MREGGDLRWLQEALRGSGLKVEAFALQTQMTRRHGAALRDWEQLIRGVLHSGDPWWVRQLLEEAGSGSRQLQALGVEVELALGDRGDPSGLIAAWVQEHRDEAAREAAVDWWVRSGRVGEAERLVAETEGLTLWRARFALWRQQPDTARAYLGHLTPDAEVRCLEAVATVQEGRLEEAESLLRTLVDSEVRAEAWSWLATVLRKQERYAEAVQAADLASIASPSFNLVARLERELAAEYLTLSASNTGAVSILDRLLRSIGLKRARMRTIGEMERAAVLYPMGLKPEEPVASLTELIERFGGNHTPYLTTVDHGALTSCHIPSDPGQLGASIQQVLWTRGADAVRALYRELVPQVNGHPRVRIYHGEIELWMGAYEEAARIFREVLERDREVKWAWIGLGASAMLQGELRQAQKIWEEGISVTRFAGPTLYVYRGECYRRLGELARARRDLEEALRQKPHRLSARINLALLDGDAESLERVARECAARAPLLMEELSGGPAEKLEKVLEAMRGNRSSSLVSYHLWGRLWRGVG